MLQRRGPAGPGAGIHQSSVPPPPRAPRLLHASPPSRDPRLKGLEKTELFPKVLREASSPACDSRPGSDLRRACGRGCRGPVKTSKRVMRRSSAAELTSQCLVPHGSDRYRRGGSVGLAWGGKTDGGLEGGREEGMEDERMGGKEGGTIERKNIVRTDGRTKHTIATTLQRKR